MNRVHRNGIGRTGSGDAHRGNGAVRGGRDRAVDETARLGFTEWFRVGEHDRVERVLNDLATLGVTRLRTGVSWADWHTTDGQRWYDWLLPHLAGHVEVLPCVLYTPPSIGMAPRINAPPKHATAYADFLDVLLSRFGRHFRWIELWNEPNQATHWDAHLDPDGAHFAEMIRHAAHWARRRGHNPVLGGMAPVDPAWLTRLASHGALKNVAAVGVGGFPGTWTDHASDWNTELDAVRDVLEHAGSDAELWITETGYATWRHNELEQMRALLRACAAPAERVYWTGVEDLQPDQATLDGLHVDERSYHFGLRDAGGRPKLLHRMLAEAPGLASVREITGADRRAASAVRRSGGSGRNGRAADGHVLITGGAGFIGTNLADRLLREGRRVRLFDNLARPGVEENLRWLRRTHGDRLEIDIADVRDRCALRHAADGAAMVCHFAAQVAVTTSLDDPLHDFDINAAGTMNLLEVLRGQRTPPPLLFTSTNKVYGNLPGLSLRRRGHRYEPRDDATRERGIGEDQCLEFHSPYGCSKGLADQAVLDYARSYDLRTVVFRMSCIYGPHQFGNEDQGWVAHFLLSALRGDGITLYGDGRQVRDVLFVGDLLDAMQLAEQRIDRVAGRVFNIGGGPDHTVSLLELIDLIEQFDGGPLTVRSDNWRTGDQRYYVSDISRFTEATGWRPRTTPAEGVDRLRQWLIRHHPTLRCTHRRTASVAVK